MEDKMEGDMATMLRVLGTVLVIVSGEITK